MSQHFPQKIADSDNYLFKFHIKVDVGLLPQKQIDGEKKHTVGVRCSF